MFGPTLLKVVKTIKGKMLEIQIEKVIPGGDGLGFYEGKAVFVPYTLTGDLVEVEIQRETKKWVRANLIRILQPAPERTNSLCPHFTVCGGCSWQHIPYDLQLKLKASHFCELFQKFSKITLPPPKVIPSNPYHYRNRVQIHRDHQGTTGFMKRNSNEILTLKECPVLSPALESFVLNLAQNTNSIPSRTQLMESEGHVYHDFNPDNSPFNTTHSLGKNENSKSTDSIAKFHSITLNNKKIYFDLRGFFQSNLKILPTFIEYITKNESGHLALDLYGGVGLFSVFLEDFFEDIYLVEENEFSVKMAKKNLQKTNHVFITKPLEKAVELQKLVGQIDLLIVDPPRQGLSESARNLILKLSPKKFTYVSCDVATQARDLGFFVPHAYTILDSCLFDFYPQTGHMESVIKLERVA